MAGNGRQLAATAGSGGLATFTLVTPSLNQGAFLEETIRSVLAQGYPALQYIVMDGGSSDESPGIIARYSRWLTDWQSAPDAGQSDAINRGMAMGTGEICGWLCSDDVLTPGALLTVGRYFAERPECQWLVGAADFVDLTGAKLDRSQGCLDSDMALLDYWRWGMPGHAVPQAACFWRRSLWQKVAGLTVGNHLAMDFELWLKFQELADLHVLDETLAVCKVHSGAKSWRQRRRLYAARRRCALAAARRRGVPLAGILWRKSAWALAWRFKSLWGKWEASSLFDGCKRRERR